MCKLRNEVQVESTFILFQYQILKQSCFQARVSLHRPTRNATGAATGRVAAERERGRHVAPRRVAACEWDEAKRVRVEAVLLMEPTLLPRHAMAADAIVCVVRDLW